MGPYSDSQALAGWTASILSARGIDEIDSWRMVGHWFPDRTLSSCAIWEGGNLAYLRETVSQQFTPFWVKNQHQMD